MICVYFILFHEISFNTVLTRIQLKMQFLTQTHLSIQHMLSHYTPLNMSCSFDFHKMFECARQAFPSGYIVTPVD